MIISFGKSFAYAFVRSAAGVAAVAVAPSIIKAIKRTPRTYQKAPISIANRMVKAGQRIGCDAEEKLFRKGG
jgi:hypothetical protein